MAREALGAGALYFAVVFGAGFALGSLRTLLVVPRVGERTAELAEAPVMLVVTVLAARWVVRRRDVPPRPMRRLAVGLVALTLLVIAEALVVVGARGLTLREYVATRDPIAGPVYGAMLLVFAVMPVIVRGSGTTA
jgi:hypothetical protein